MSFCHQYVISKLVIVSVNMSRAVCIIPNNTKQAKSTFCITSTPFQPKKKAATKKSSKKAPPPPPPKKSAPVKKEPASDGAEGLEVVGGREKG